MITGADGFVHAETGGLDAAAIADRLRAQGLFAPLFVKHAFG